MAGMTGETTSVTVELSAGSFRRLERICALRGYDLKEAVEYAIAYGWLMAERKGMEYKVRHDIGSRELHGDWERRW